jgi:hypothetical protein
MTQRKRLSLAVGVLVGLAVCIAILVMPQRTDAGGVHLSIGIGVPAPAYVVPPPVVVQPAPVIVQPIPRIVYPGTVYPPVYCDVYGRPLSPGSAKRYYGHPGYGYKFYKHGKYGW